MAMGALAAGQARAVIVNVEGQDWDVTTFTGGYYSNSSNFETAANGGLMPWWNNQGLASLFATTVWSSLGDPGPYFAYATDPTTYGGVGTIFQFIYESSHDGACPGCTAVFEAGKHGLGPGYGGPQEGWAQATPYTPSAAPVPGPLPALGAAAAFGFSRKLRKRIKGSTNALSSSNSL
jgi:hypothetical protein